MPVKTISISHPTDSSSIAQSDRNSLTDDQKTKLKNLFNEKPTGQYTQNEIKQLWKSQHPHEPIPKIWGIRKDSPQELYFQFERVKKPQGIQLGKFLKNKQNLPPLKQLDIAIQLIEKMNAIHEAGYVHRNINFKNLLWDAHKNELIIAGLGNASKENALSFGTNQFDFLSSEFLNPNVAAYYTRKADIYSLGVALKEILGFSDNFINTPNNFYGDDEMEKLLNSMLDQNPNKRHTLTEVLNKLNAYKEQLLSITPTIVGVIDFSDFINAKDKSAFVNALKSVDKVIITDTNINSTADTYTATVRLLEKHGIAVENKVYQSPHIQECIQEIQNESTNKIPPTHLCYFTTTKTALKDVQSLKVDKGKDYKTAIKYATTPVTDSQKQRVLEVLNEERERLREKYPEKDIKSEEDSLSISMANNLFLPKVNQRKELLDTAISQIEKNSNKMTQAQLFKILNKTEKDILTLQSKKFRYFTGFIKKNTARKIHKVIKEVKSAPEFIPKMRR